MGENQQRKHEQLQRRLIQEAKEDGIPYAASPMLKVGAKIMSDNAAS